MLLVGLTTLIDQGTYQQLFCGTAIAVGAAIVLAKLAPYKHAINDYLALACQASPHAL